MIKIYTEMIRKRYADKLDEKGQQYMSFVVEGATRMDALINDLLAYSEVGKTDALKGEADLGQAVANSLINLKGAIDEAGAQIVVGALPVVQGNEGQLTQVFQNLIGNALKFKGPTRTQIQVDCQSREKDWLVSVKDNGIGIEAQYLEKIFVIFCRLHSREGYPGTGVGLAICKRIVERHGGRIWVRSQPAAGSVFEFTIPRRDRR
jgi:light-regulated signal transduction histidine kinase (bacteriophytochrome)